LERFFAAGERLYSAHPVDSVTVPQIVEAASSSVGAFYKRFAGKEAFLSAFYDMFFERIRAVARQELDPARWDGRPAREITFGLVELRLAHYRKHRNLLAKLFLHARLHGDSEFVRHMVRFGDEATASMTTLLSAAHPDLQTPPSFPRVRTALVIAMIALRERILYGRQETRTDALEREYSATIARMLWLELSTPVEEVGR
jgi:AcrR family transcriptional regulator